MNWTMYTTADETGTISHPHRGDGMRITTIDNSVDVTHEADIKERVDLTTDHRKAEATTDSHR